MNRYEETFHSWNSVASLYEEYFMDLSLYDTSYKKLIQLISRSKPSIFEIGCGPANISKKLLELKSDIMISGIDVSENMVELARKNIPSGEFYVKDCRQLKQSIDTYNAVVAGFVIPYLSEEETLLLIQNVHKILHENGLFYLSYVPGKSSDSGFVTGSNNQRMYFYYHPKNLILRYLIENQFSIEHEEEVKYIKRDQSAELHQIIIVRKETGF